MEREEEGEKHQCVVASQVLPTGDLAHIPGMCPDWESNQQPFGLKSSAQSTEPQQPGLQLFKEAKIPAFKFPLKMTGINLEHKQNKLHTCIRGLKRQWSALE